MSKFTNWLNSEKGASMVEYGLLVVLIAIVALTALAVMGEELSTLFSDINSNLLGAKSQPTANSIVREEGRQRPSSAPGWI
ncbi:hypothetical protein BH23ACT4_BH23ACT4_13100 [soil metagenome]